MPGLFVVNLSIATSQVIEDILLIELCSEPNEWQGRVIYLPL